MYRIHGVIKNYAWGGFDFIPQLLNQPATDQPAAELWFGDHPQGMATVDNTPLNDWLAAHPDTLSPAARARFGDQLPFLLKILDVRLPLSIQLHPDKAQAEAGFAREEAAGIARDAAERNYQDDNHKPEMMVALSEFWLLHGFADAATIRANLSARPSLQPVLTLIETQTLHDAYRHIMTASQDELAAWLLPILAQSPPAEISANPDYWLHHAVQTMNITPDNLDAGLLSFYLFNIVRIQENDGIFQAARLPHAYLSGQNIELMAASNNVLRAGLTPKHIDIPELLRIIDAKSISPAIIHPTDGEMSQYPAPIDDFTLETARLTAGNTLCKNTPEVTIVLNLSGKTVLSGQNTTLTLSQGEAALVPFGREITAQALENSYLVFASHR